VHLLGRERAISASARPATAHTHKKTSSGTAERRESSSSGNASVTGGPGTADRGWTM
jgi:hypothetical protein